MRIKEAAERSGLTEKAIRLYEEKGLILPAITEINGRKFRDYDEATVAQLKTIAGLRRSFFSLEQIAAMQESPERIPEIFTEYRHELKKQYDRLGMLIGKADEILSQIPETDLSEKSVVTPSALRDVDTLSEAMTAVTPVVVSEEIPPSAPPTGRRERAKLHFRRWDEEIASDEREIVYQRYLEYYSRWEKRYAAELAVGRVFDWIGRRKKILFPALLAGSVCLFLAWTGIYVPYSASYDGYLLMLDRFASDEPYRIEPVSVRLEGERYYHLWLRDRFEGELLIDGYTPHSFGPNGWYSIENGEIKFSYYHRIIDRTSGYENSMINGLRGVSRLI
ncbi:MAG: MerR family transcriptional regulator, partial [Clostridia bacterium]|nr:MerR family transcriptional regulator [Clostridia bacterium]